MRFKSLRCISLAGLALMSIAAPSPRSCHTTAGGLSAETLLEIAPTSATCAGAVYPAECRTNTQAICPILSSFATYNISNPAVQAAIVSLIAYESGDFKYANNHWPSPGRPQQGTRNMQMPSMNSKYAESLGGMTYDEIQANDDYSFGSAAWYLATQCNLQFRENMWTGSQTAYAAYLSSCVGTDANAERVAYWTRAMRVLRVAIVYK